MKKSKFLVLLLIVVGFACSKQETLWVDYVDPFIGTQGEGNTFPGATLPYGMVKLGPDCGHKRSNSGYIPNAVIHGFSHTHVSGTGGGPKYGNILVMPFTDQFLLKTVASKPANYSASPGYMSVDLSQYNIHAELTCSHSAGFHRYFFPKNTEKGILIDAGSFLGAGSCCGESQELLGSEIKILSNTQVEGFTRVKGGWNKGGEYTVFFVALFDCPATEFGVWKNGEVKSQVKIVNDTGDKTGAYFRFDPSTKDVIQVKVGISFISTKKAYENLMHEINHWDFEKVHQNAVRQWNAVLNTVQVKDEDETLKTLFYTALYHTMLMPTDRTGENPLWVSHEPYYDDYYAIWDTYRATHPLLTLIQPERQRDMIRSLVDIYVHEGFMPDARSGNHTGRTQGGSNCDVLIADAMAKGLSGINYEKALESMIKNAEISPELHHQKWGRGGIKDYHRFGFVSPLHERAGSRTVEYAYNDYCVSRVAKALGKEKLAQKYLNRSHNWKNLWKPIEDSGATGFIMPRKVNGKWADDFKGRVWDPVKDWYSVPFTPHTAGTWPDFFYEADSWEYSFYVPHDVKGLIKKCGGKKKFIDRLDTFFKKQYYNVGNEPSFLTPCLYTYAGRQDKTNAVVRNIIEQYYTDSHDGIPGNDDAGSMSAWLAFHLMGFFPNAGQDIYLITAPHFQEISMNLGNRKYLKIVSHHLTDENIYISQVVLNGKPLNRAWFQHHEIAEGGKLEFYMSNQPDNSWETRIPPSVE